MVDSFYFDQTDYHFQMEIRQLLNNLPDANITTSRVRSAPQATLQLSCCRGRRQIGQIRTG